MSKEKHLFKVQFDQFGDIKTLKFKNRTYEGRGDFVSIPVSHLKDVRLKNIPDNVGINPVLKIKGSCITSLFDYDCILYKNCGSITIMELRKYWRGILGLEYHMYLLAEAIQTKSREIRSIHFDDIQEDEQLIMINFHVDLNEDMLVLDAIKTIDETIMKGVSVGLERLSDTFHIYIKEQFPQYLSKINFETELMKKWEEALAEKDSNKKGLALERLVKLVFLTINGLQPSHRVQTQTEEIDIFIRNESPDAFWSKLSPFILVECKNWSSKVGKDEIVIFRSKLENRFGLSKVGFLVSINGFYDTVKKEMIRSSKGDISIVLVDGAALKKLVLNPNRNEYLKELLGTSICA